MQKRKDHRRHGAVLAQAILIVLAALALSGLAYAWVRGH